MFWHGFIAGIVTEIAIVAIVVIVSMIKTAGRDDRRMGMK